MVNSCNDIHGIQPYPYKTEPEKFDPYFGFVHHQMASPPSRSAWDSLVTHLRSQAEKLSGPPHQAVPLGIQILEVAVRMMAATFCSPRNQMSHQVHARSGSTQHIQPCIHGVDVYLQVSDMPNCRSTWLEIGRRTVTLAESTVLAPEAAWRGRGDLEHCIEALLAHLPIMHALQKGVSSVVGNHEFFKHSSFFQDTLPLLTPDDAPSILRRIRLRSAARATVYKPGKEAIVLTEMIVTTAIFTLAKLTQAYNIKRLVQRPPACTAKCRSRTPGKHAHCLAALLRQFLKTQRVLPPDAN